MNPKSIRNQFEALMKPRGYNGRITAKANERGVQLRFRPPLADWQVSQVMQLAAQVAPSCIPTASNEYLQLSPYLAYSWTGEERSAGPLSALPAATKPRPAYLDPAVVVPFLLLLVVVLALLSRAL